MQRRRNPGTEFLLCLPKYYEPSHPPFPHTNVAVCVVTCKPLFWSLCLTPLVYTLILSLAILQIIGRSIQIRLTTNPKPHMDLLFDLLLFHVNNLLNTTIRLQQFDADQSKTHTHTHEKLLKIGTWPQLLHVSEIKLGKNKIIIIINNNNNNNTSFYLSLVHYLLEILLLIIPLKSLSP